MEINEKLSPVSAQEQKINTKCISSIYVYISIIRKYKTLSSKGDTVCPRSFNLFYIVWKLMRNSRQSQNRNKKSKQKYSAQYIYISIVSKCKTVPSKGNTVCPRSVNLFYIVWKLMRNSRQSQHRNKK